VPFLGPLAGLALAAIWAPGLVDLGRIWWTDPYAGHGMFVPLLSALFVWRGREELRAAAGPGQPAGLLVVVAGLGLMALGRWVGSPLVQGASVVAAAAGFGLWRLGARWLRAAAFPIAFLVFMAPLPRAVVGAVTADLQAFAAGFAGLALEALDIPFYLDGTRMELSTIRLEVAEVCNGLRFLTGLVVMTTAFAWVTQRTLPRGLVLVGAAVPVAIVANAIRVAAVVAAVHYIGPEAASGTIHNWIGKGVWGLTLLPLGVLGLVLRGGAEARPRRLGALSPSAGKPGRT
jgi:exosortase